MKDNPTIIILAAGQGKRMNSSLPKPLHKVGGKPTLARVMEAARPISEDVVIVVGNGREAVMDVLGNDHRYAVQEEQRGTGHAVLSAKEAAGEVKAGDVVIVLPGDHPLMSTEAIRELLDTHRGRGAKITIVTHAVPDFEADRHIFSHHGRIKRNEDGHIERIVELKDADETERLIPEINVGFYCFDAEWLFEQLPKLSNSNAAGEYYITDLVRAAREQNIAVHAYTLPSQREAMGFNTPEELAAIERFLET